LNYIDFIMTRTKFKNADEAYEYLQNEILLEGVPFDDTRALFNVGFTLENPLQNHIRNNERNWNHTYAEREWNWYMSGDPNAEDIAKKAPIWYKMMDSEGCVRSNYGWQWQRNNQLDYVCAKLKDNPNTRHAAISIYDAKEWDTYRKDTPCTYAVQFTVLNNRLNMCVVMRSNDLWYGFCNDQYCFSNLQNLVSERTGYEVGEYYHFAHNLHLYNDKIN
jgi:thymidylate synthase